MHILDRTSYLYSITAGWADAQWREDVACKNSNGRFLVIKKTQQNTREVNKCIDICRNICPVRYDCLRDALKLEDIYGGIRGGFLKDELKQFNKQVQIRSKQIGKDEALDKVTAEVIANNA